MFPMSASASTSNSGHFPTQSGQPTSRVFVAADGSSFPIFVDSNGVTNNRPKLIRTLRNAGATICTDVLRSRIILVEPNTKEGRQFVRDWGLDPGKTVLDYTWAYRCMEAGRALLENDGWGGCGDLDGTPLDGDLEDEDRQDGPSTSQSNRAAAAKPKKPPPQALALSHNGRDASASFSSLHTPSPLPTPRPANVRHFPQSPQPTQSQHMDSTYTSSSSQTPHQYHTPPSISTSNSPMIPPYLPKPHRSPPLSTLVQTMQTHQSTHNMQSPRTQFLQAVPPPTSPPIPYDVALPGTQPYPTFQQQVVNMMNTNPELMAGAMMMLQQMSNTGGMNAMVPMNGAGAIQVPYNPAQAWPGMPQPAGSLQPPQVFQSSISPTQQSFQSPFTNGSTQPPNHDRIASPIPVRAETINYLSPVMTEADRASESPTLSDEERSIVTQTAKRRSSDSKILSGPISKRARKDPESRSSSASQTAPNSSRKERKKRSSINGPVELKIETLRPESVRRSSTTTGIFTDSKGRSMPFFVQVDMRNRVAITGMVKKNGGRITPHMEEAEFIILTSQSKSTKALMKDVKSIKRHALTQDFVKACVEQGAIVDEEEYVLAPELTPYQRRKLEESKDREKRAASQQRAPRMNSREYRSSSRSPTPPTSVQEIADGRNKYTTEEKEYIRKYATYLFRGEPNAALNVLIKRISERVPSHSSSSWQNTIYNSRDEIERIREGTIAEKKQTDENKADEANVEDAIAPSYQDSDPSTARAAGTDHQAVPDCAADTNQIPGLVSAYNAINDKKPEDVEADLATIINFFVDERDSRKSGYDDALLWAKLESKYECRTAPSWQDFYEAHMQEVNERLLTALTDI